MCRYGNPGPTPKETAGSVMTNKQLTRILEQQRQAFLGEAHVSLSTRLNRLDRCIALLIDNQDAICTAVNLDFGGRSHIVTQMSDLLTSVNELKHVKKNLKKWMRAEKRKAPFPMNLIGGRSLIHYQPKGVVGIMSPWNVPINVIFSPLADALGAGNRA
ncbi:MAG: aldehyde dehydrogenase family protein, partial [Porticoccaceae bacterium]|nr:aldehyde dehydrogenase family protein [Porticoccaceae bacterium]